MKSRAAILFAVTLAIAVGGASALPSAEQRDNSAAQVDVLLLPTNHPRLPADLSQLWLAPETSRGPRTAALNQLAEAVRLEGESNFARALAILSQPSLRQGTLGHYAEYYKGLAELRLGDAVTARLTFRALAGRAAVGYLREAATLGEAECNEALGDWAEALAVYERLSKINTTAPDDVLMRMGRAARALGDREQAAAAFSRVYYEFPFSDLAAMAGAELDKLPNDEPIAAGTNRYKLELGRAEQLFAAKRYGEARAAFEGIRRAAQGDDEEVVDLRLAECDYFLKRPRSARDRVKPYIEKASRQGEALFVYASAVRELGDEAGYLRTIRRVVDTFPTQRWSEEALNDLATHYITRNDDARADGTFREMYEKFPLGFYAERAAWKIGWWAYRNGRYPDTIRVFERAAADFPRSDYRPPWLYWSARAHDALREPVLAQARYALVVTDYLNSYYGRLAVKRLDNAPQPRLVVDIQAPSNSATLSEATGDSAPTASLPPNQHVVRALLGLKLYDHAINELRYAQRTWGNPPAIEATIAWVYQEQGQSQSGTQQFTLLRGAITTMKRAYPQYMAAGGENLPQDVLKVIFPLAYRDLIRKHAAERNLDPYLLAALVAQESTFVPDIRSAANAVGLMQLLPSTARQYAKMLKMPYSPRLLTNPEANIRVGTAYLADKIKQFRELHLVLACYNAGEESVSRWAAERTALAPDEFIDDIPYAETRNYVKKILGTAEDYRRLYGSELKLADEVADAVPAAAHPAPVAKARATSTSVKKKPASPSRKTSSVRRARTTRDSA